MMQLRMVFNYSQWGEFLRHQNLVFQYTIKRRILHLLDRMYYNNSKQQRASTEDVEALQAILYPILCDISAFLQFQSSKSNDDLADYNMFVPEAQFFSENVITQEVLGYYQEFLKLPLDKATQKLYYERISLVNAWEEYIYKACLPFLSSLLMNEGDWFKVELTEDKTSFTSMLDVTLFMFVKLSSVQSHAKNEAYKKLNVLLKNLLPMRQYRKCKRTIQTAQKFLSQEPLLASEKIQIGFTGRTTVNATSTFEHQLSILKANKKVYKEQNLLNLSSVLYSSKGTHCILSELVKYISQDPSKLEEKDIIIVLRIIRRFIESENSLATDTQIYEWNNILITDLQNILKLQNDLMEMHLTDALFSLLWESRSDVIMKEVAHLSLAYLYGGNRGIQDQFLERLESDPDNEIIIRIRNMLDKCFDKFTLNEYDRMKSLYENTLAATFEYLEGQEIDGINVQKMFNVINHQLPEEIKCKAIQKSDNRTLIILLRFVQTLCEGQHSGLQHFLIEQKVEDGVLPASFNFLEFARTGFRRFSKFCCQFNVAFGIQILDTLMEFIQGKNDVGVRHLLMQSFVYDLCTALTELKSEFNLLSRCFDPNPYYGLLMNFKSKCVEVLKSLTEYPDPANIPVMRKNIDKQGLFEVFEEIMKEFFWGTQTCTSKNPFKTIHDRRKQLTNQDFHGNLATALNIYVIFRNLWEDGVMFNQKMKDMIEDPEKNRTSAEQSFLNIVLNYFCTKVVASVELVMQDDSETLIKVWFPKFPVCSFLNSQAKFWFLKHVDRSNTQTKISGLIKHAPEFISQMESDYESRKTSINMDKAHVYSALRYSANSIAITLNIMLLALWKFENGQPVLESLRIERAVLGLSIVQTFLAFGVVFWWTKAYRRKQMHAVWEMYVESNVKEMGMLPPNIEAKIKEYVYSRELRLDRQECNLVLQLCGPYSTEFELVKKQPELFQHIRWRYFRKSLIFSVSSFTLMWHIIYMAICMLSIPFSNNWYKISGIFTTLQVIDIAIRSDTLTQISQAIIRNWRQFIWTLFLLLLAVQFYTFIGFFYYNSAFVDDDGTDLCGDTFQCFLNVLNLGLRSGGGIAEIMQMPDYNRNSSESYLGRVIFDLSFFVIMIILLLNLIFGMIIDAFGELRDQKTNNDEDQKNVCFICGYERSEFERQGNFERHVQKEHNIWDYVYYLVYLKDKYETNKLEMTAIENSVIEKYSKKEYDWVPIGRSTTLEKELSDENKGQQNELKKIREELVSLKTSIKQNSQQSSE